MRYNGRLKVTGAWLYANSVCMWMHERLCVCVPCLSAILFTHHYFQAVIQYMAEGKEEQFFASREYAEESLCMSVLE